MKIIRPLDKQEKRLIVFLLLVYLLVIIRNLYDKDPTLSFLWFCDVAPLLLILFISMKNIQLVKGIINIGFIPQLIVVFDLIIFLVFKGEVHPFGLSLGYFGGEMSKASTLGIIVEVILHVFPINLVLILTYKEKPSPKSLVYSAMIVLLLYAVTAIFTAKDANVNMVFNPPIDIPYYHIVWPIFVFAVWVLPTYGLQHLIWKLSTQKSRRNKLPMH